MKKVFFLFVLTWSAAVWWWNKINFFLPRTLIYHARLLQPFFSLSLHSSWELRVSFASRPPGIVSVCHIHTMFRSISYSYVCHQHFSLSLSVLFFSIHPHYHHQRMTFFLLWWRHRKEKKKNIQVPFTSNLFVFQ